VETGFVHGNMTRVPGIGKREPGKYPAAEQGCSCVRICDIAAFASPIILTKFLFRFYFAQLGIVRICLIDLLTQVFCTGIANI